MVWFFDFWLDSTLNSWTFISYISCLLIFCSNPNVSGSIKSRRWLNWFLIFNYCPSLLFLDSRYWLIAISSLHLFSTKSLKWFLWDLNFLPPQSKFYYQYISNHYNLYPYFYPEANSSKFLIKKITSWKILPIIWAFLAKKSSSKWKYPLCLLQVVSS